MGRARRGGAVVVQMRTSMRSPQGWPPARAALLVVERFSSGGWGDRDLLIRERELLTGVIDASWMDGERNAWTGGWMDGWWHVRRVQAFRVGRVQWDRSFSVNLYVHV